MSEHDEQVLFFDWVRQNLSVLAPFKMNKVPIPSRNPDLFRALRQCHSNLTGGMFPKVKNKDGKWWSPIAKKMKREGMMEGVWDIHLDVPTEPYSGLRIEMKFGKNKLTIKQKEKQLDLEFYAFKTQVCYSGMEAIAAVIDYLPFERKQYTGV